MQEQNEVKITLLYRTPGGLTRSRFARSSFSSRKYEQRRKVRIFRYGHILCGLTLQNGKLTTDPDLVLFYVKLCIRDVIKTFEDNKHFHLQ